MKWTTQDGSYFRAVRPSVCAHLEVFFEPNGQWIAMVNNRSKRAAMFAAEKFKEGA